MSDLISRQDAIEAITNTRSMVAYHDASESVLYGSAFRQNEIIDIINALPSAEPKTGKWKPKNHHTDYCSNCGFEETQWRTADYNFCPSCGARMKGADDE